MAIEKHNMSKDADSIWTDLDNTVFQLQNVIEDECIDIVEEIINVLYNKGLYESVEYDNEVLSKEDVTYNRSDFEEILTRRIDEHKYCTYEWYSRMVVAIESDIAGDVVCEYGEEVDLDNLSNIAYWILYEKCEEIAEDNYDFDI